MVVLMLNKIYGRVDAKTDKFGYIPMIYYVAMKGTIFNSANIVANSLSTTITIAQEGLHQKK